MNTWNLILLTAAFGHCLSSKDLSEIKDSNWFETSQFFHSSTKLKFVCAQELCSSAYLYSILIVTTMN